MCRMTETSRLRGEAAKASRAAEAIGTLQPRRHRGSSSFRCRAVTSLISNTRETS